MKKSAVIICLVMLAVFVVCATALYYSNQQLIHDAFDDQVVQILTVPMDVKVSDHFGINVDPDALHFGKVPRDNAGIRGFTLNSSFTIPVQAELWFSGNIAPWISASENNVILAPFATREINLTVSIPVDAPYETKTGTLHVVFRRLPE